MTRTARWWIGSALAAYVVAVVAVVTWPMPVDSGFEGGVAKALARLHEWGLPSAIDYFVVEALANVAMFIPLGLLLTLLLPLRFSWLPVLGLAALSTSIEIFQGLFLPSRFAMVQDIVMNTMGGAIGTLLGVIVLLRVRRSRSDGERTPATRPLPSVPLSPYRTEQYRTEPVGVHRGR